MAPSVKPFLTSKNITVIGNPPYSLDLASCDFFFVQLNPAEREPSLPQLKKYRLDSEVELVALTSLHNLNTDFMNGGFDALVD
ncbi:hypothetical protein TNCV_1142171 [Trichonephila clavipes]|nr:hypothetical protein TNCV_1142171 [Trichonephila clavipes]